MSGIITLSIEEIEKLNGGDVDPSVKYNGTFHESEDEYDYVKPGINRGLRGVRIA